MMGNDQIVGIISIGDLVKDTISDQEFVIDQLERYIYETHWLEQSFNKTITMSLSWFGVLMYPMFSMEKMRLASHPLKALKEYLIL